jgi:uncharacterized protein
MIVTGYASLFNVQDNGRDVVKRGAFANSLKKRGPKEVRFLWSHNQHEPIGVLTELREDEKGLKFTGEILPETRYGPTAIALIEKKGLKVSIGYKTITPKFVNDVRELHEVDLREVSLVTLPMLDGAEVWRAPANGKVVAEKADGQALEVLGAMNLALTTAAAHLALAAHTAR